MRYRYPRDTPGTTRISRDSAGLFATDVGCRPSSSTGSGSYGHGCTAKGRCWGIAEFFEAHSFDIILCHNVLEFVEDPGVVLRGVARLLRRSSGILSVLVRNQPGEVLKAALVNGDLTAAENTLGTAWGDESLYGGKVRLFVAKELRAMLEDASLAVVADRGVRVVSDYLPQKVSRTDAYERILQFERKLGAQPEFAAIARYTHCIARAHVRS